MKRFNPTLFFIKSILIYLFMAISVFVISQEFFEPAANSLAHNATSSQVKNDDIVLIVIDDKSIERYRWPWKRELYGKIFNYINNYTNVKVMGFDAIISSLDNEAQESDNYFFNAVKNSDKLVVGFNGIKKDFTDDFAGNKYFEAFNKKFAIEIDNKSKNTGNKWKYNSMSKFPKPYMDSLKTAGSVSTPLNYNGDVSETAHLISVKNNLYPSLSLRMYMLMNDANKITLTDKYIFVDGTDTKIPVSYEDDLYISNTRFYKLKQNSVYSHKTYSAIDIIDSYENIRQGKKPKIDPSEFDNKIVFVGGYAKASALGLEDALPTPIASKHPGVDIQATNLENILNYDYMNEIPAARSLLIIIVLTIISFIVISKLPFFKSIIVLTLIGTLYVIFACMCYKHNIRTDIITPLAIQLITMIFGYSYRFIVEGRNKEKIKQAMGKYLSQDIMKNVVQNIDDIKLGGKKATLTVLFADIRGFTSISEKLSAEEVSVILNEYFTEIEPIITKYNGVINKFIGDAVMALFGEPIQDVNHAKNAVLCANEMLKAVDKLRDKWLFEGKPKIEIGIGINTGEAFVGNIGSEKRLEYTVIGDMVNLASRIESYNKVYKTNLLISSSTYEHVSNIADVIKISEVTIRGKSKKMDIYEVLRLT